MRFTLAAIILLISGSGCIHGQSIKNTVTTSAKENFAIKGCQYTQAIFGVYFGSKKVGTLIAEKITNHQIITYAIHSEVKINLIIELKIEESIKDVFTKDLLISSVHTREVNDVQKVKNTVVNQGDTYFFNSDNKPTGGTSEQITATICSLYFNEPVNETVIYSESYQQLITITSSKPNTYEMQLPNGTTTTYKYTGPKLMSVFSNTTWGDLKFVREN